jgi:hypothetical protein
MSQKPYYKPGEICPTSGQYEIVGPKGGGTNEERTVVKGKRFPPAPRTGQKFRLVDPTKH